MARKKKAPVASRALKPSGDAIKALRIQRLMGVEDLADRAKLSKRTIERMENTGEPVFMFTIVRVAEALGVEPVSLLAEVPDPPKKQDRRLSMQMRVTEPIDNAGDGVVWLIDNIRQAIGGDMEVSDLSDDGFTLTVQMSKKEMLGLAMAIKMVKTIMAVGHPYSISVVIALSMLDEIHLPVECGSEVIKLKE